MTVDPAQLAEHLGKTVVAVGGLGTAAFGIVDGMKFVPFIDLAGFSRVFSDRARTDRAEKSQGVNLDGLLPALQNAYGEGAMELLRAQFRNGRDKGDLPRTLRQGVRIGFGMMHADAIAAAVVAIGIPADVALAGANALVAERALPAPGEAPAQATDEQRAAIVRIETAIDARIEASLSLATLYYVTQMKLWATGVSLAIAFFVNWMLGGKEWATAFIVGLAAVPIAPIAKDLATALQEAVKALKGS